ncbi:YeiH family protein [Paramicrobacterium fandaimingii]|uniref:YeiH family protein n=1 Tax=Paramicrobacterium fandaimingii TaxID=2708079 RepID=UPI00141F5D0D|nr:putative sulfate exporter family transporter [Microbacterium fandaimingii]
MAHLTEEVQLPQTRRRPTIVPLLPGLGLCALAVVVSLLVNHLVPAVSALLIAIVLGMLLRNLVPLSAAFDAGLAFSAKKLLRLGVVLLGLQLVVGDVLGLGAGVVVVVIAVVVGGIAATLLIGKLMGIGFTQRLLIACGFSICGAAAVAAVDGVVEPDDDDEVVTAIALVVLFGTLMIPLVPLAAGALGLGPHDAGLWAGGSIHEVAQVVAAGGVIGGGALGVAVIVKLARVLMLAPVMAVISAVRRRRSAGTGGKRPPMMPLFVVGFIAMVALRSLGIVPEGIVDVASVVQNALLAAAMFALGAGVKIRNLIKVGPKPFALAACSTVVVAGIALGGVMLVA